MQRGLLALVAALALVIGCSPSTAPAPAAGAKPPAAPAAAPASGAPPPAAGAPSTSQADAAYRQQVVDGARAEGQVNVAIQSTWTPEGIKQLEEAIAREYGVQLKINFTPVQNYIQRFSELAAEMAAGTNASFDVNQTSDTNALMMLDNNLLEAVNWPALLPQGTPPAIMKGDGRLLVVLTDHIGLMYDPTVIAEADVPRSLKDLGDPRWRGKAVMMQYGSAYIPWAVKLGKEQTLAALRAAVQNGAAADIYANEYTRFAAKEYGMAVIVASYVNTAQKRGISAAFAPLDFSNNGDHYVVVPKKVAHPNAAKLVAAVLVGPEGQRIAEEQVGYSNRYYDGSTDARIEQAARAAGFASFALWDSPEARALSLGPEGEEFAREVDRIFKGG